MEGHDTVQDAVFDYSEGNFDIVGGVTAAKRKPCLECKCPVCTTGPHIFQICSTLSTVFDCRELHKGIKLSTHFKLVSCIQHTLKRHIYLLSVASAYAMMAVTERRPDSFQDVEHTQEEAS